MNIKLVVASGNSSKLTEIRQMVPQSFEIVSMKELGFTGDIPETADSFSGNALIKARFINSKFAVNCLADDSGLEVEALDGRPGVFSARFAGAIVLLEQSIGAPLSLQMTLSMPEPPVSEALRTSFGF